jgi:hypothetical protein
VELPPGTVAVLSLVMSNGRNSGQFVTNKPFVRCRPEEMKNEALSQIGLYDELKDVSYAIGPDLEFLPLQDYLKDPQRYVASGASKLNTEEILISDGLLYVRMPQNLDNEPANFTDVHNFFIAGEFTRTNFVIPTMEKSCESGMRAASAICETSGNRYEEARLEPATLPLGFLRKHWFHLLVRVGSIALIAGGALLLFWRVFGR